ncbi:gamma-glutamyltranspeptidase/glutathione hydrolase [Thermocatellispora tengchongensis]|uniref:Gamma-glutamyltranspeptidase/glutathione hydrolase n=1 Tax=Thermocatellispora tengchongensis TaxID=1073253 RepID=A0A840PLG1_9ACTN|nr:gamma-glutamyltransferase [Thermocatellispora tengchongensis]MBB5137897.1 gamma-glutamyltranspeptidase/glutathione hydrolase [Thermocatellispora tengchongensis]
MGWTRPAPFTTRPTLEGTVGMAASTHWAASATAMGVLERGGTAFDAAVAAGFVLQVVEPHLNGPGGDLVALFTTAGDPTPRVLDGQGPAPAGASAKRYRELGLDRVPGAGALAAAIPGAVDAWLMLLRDHGTWEVADVVGPAIGYARHGFPAVTGLCTTISAVAGLFREHWADSAALWLPGGRPPVPGQVLRNPVWAGTLERLAAAATGPTRQARVDAVRRAWAEGFVAEAVEKFCVVPHRHSCGTDHAGVLTGADMAGYRARITAAAVGGFRGYRIAKTPPWGQGPALLAALATLDGFDDCDLDPSTERGAHLVLEAMKLALADRDAWYGESDGALLDVEDLLDPGYVAERRSLIGEEASADLRPGRLGGLVPRLPDLARVEAPEQAGEEADEGAVGEPTVRIGGEVRGDTCHLDVVDRWGNLVSATPSGGWLQSSPVIPALGFALGTRLQMTWLQDGLPATLTPGRRPRTTLTPTLVLREETPIAALGSPGGDQQDQWQLLYLLRTIVGGYTPQQAIDAPAFHTTSAPSSFWPRHRTPAGAVVEDRLGERVIAALERRGHRVTRAGDWALGRLSAVGRDPARPGVLWAAANPRGMQGYAVGR